MTRPMDQANDPYRHLFCHHLAIPCQFGALEGRLLFADAGQKGPGVVICPPHPLLAGNMDNNVVAAIASTLGRYYPVLLFNYRGVGLSDAPDGHMPLYERWRAIDSAKEYEDIATDVGTVVRFASRYFEGIQLVGYSFGSYVALQAIDDLVTSFTAIAPPLNEHDFSSLGSLAIPCLVLQAETDTLLGERLPPPENFQGIWRTIHSSDHFFRGREQDLADQILAFLQQDRRASEPCNQHLRSPG